MTRCKKCNMEIIFATNQNGKLIPLDAKAHVYKLVNAERCERVENHHVTHFATCPWATHFSKQSKKSGGRTHGQ